MTKHTISAALLGGIVLAWSAPTAANETWGLQIYFEPAVVNADPGDTAMFFDCATSADCGNGNYNHIPPYDFDAGSHYPGLFWVFFSVPASTWYLWAGCRPPYPCADGGNSLKGNWAVITEDGINLGPTIIIDKETWRQWADKATGIYDATQVATNYCRYIGNKGCSAATQAFGGVVNTLARRFAQLANDPYDPDYQTVPDGSPWSSLPYTGNRCGDNALTAMGRIGGLLDGLVAAADRYPSALVNKDQASADNQAAAVSNLSGRLHAILDPVQTQLPGVLSCGPYLSGVDTSQLTTVDYYAFEALFGPKDGRNSAWQQLDAAVQ